MICDEVCAIGVAYGSPPLDASAIVASLSSHRPSILRDLDSGRSMEIDPLLTVPLELAQAVGVAVPTLEMVAALVRARARSAGLYNG